MYVILLLLFLVVAIHIALAPASVRLTEVETRIAELVDAQVEVWQSERNQIRWENSRIRVYTKNDDYGRISNEVRAFLSV